MQVRARLLNNPSRPKPGAWHRAMFHGNLSTGWESSCYTLWVPRKLIDMNFAIIFFKIIVMNPADKTPLETKPLSSVVQPVSTSMKVISLNLPGPR